MFNLLICEDEPLILLGLKKLIQGFGLPIRKIFLANDGEEALRIFSQHPVDLVVTDIQMPGSSGLELLERLQKLRGSFQAVIISGYNDFEYAKTAIHLGIQEYLLKPVEPHELKTALIHCMDNMRRHISQECILSGILLDQIQEIWGPDLPRETSTQLLQAGNGFFLEEAFGFLAFYTDGKEALSQIVSRIEPFFQKRFSHRLTVPRTPHFFCVILNLSKKEAAWFEELPAQLEAALAQTCPQGGASCGISPRAESLFQLKEAALQAEQALCHRLGPAGRTQKVFLWAAIPPDLHKERAQLLQLADSLCSALRLPEIGAVEKDWDKIVQLLDKHPGLLPCLPVCLRKTEDFLAQELGEPGCSFCFAENYTAGDSLDQVHQEVKKKLLEVCRARLRRQMAQQDPVSQALEYMEQNYQKPLSLTILANVVSLNYTYFSNIFKERTGISATKYLQLLRIRKAKELLISTDDRVREIAHKTGFTDERYFEKLFKRYEGVTPSDYRDQLKNFTAPPQ